MNICLNCAYFISCNKASEEIRECDKYKKMSYEVIVERKENETSND